MSQQRPSTARNKYIFKKSPLKIYYPWMVPASLSHKPLINNSITNCVCLQFKSVTPSCPTLHNPTDCSTPGLPVHHQLPELTQTHVHWVGDAIRPSHPLLSPSPPAFNLSQHQGLFQWVSSSHQTAKVSVLLESKRKTEVSFDHIRAWEMTVSQNL